MLPQWISYSVEPMVDTYTGRQVQIASVECEVCGEWTQAPPGTADVARFIRQHSEHRSSDTHYGLGDVIAGATKAVGVEPCTPCEERRRQLNALLPNLWRR